MLKRHLAAAFQASRRQNTATKVLFLQQQYWTCLLCDARYVKRRHEGKLLTIIAISINHDIQQLCLLAKLSTLNTLPGSNCSYFTNRLVSDSCVIRSMLILLYLHHLSTSSMLAHANQRYANRFWKERFNFKAAPQCYSLPAARQ